MIPVSAYSNHYMRRYNAPKPSRPPLAPLPAHLVNNTPTRPRIPQTNSNQHQFNTDVVMEDENGDIILCKPAKMAPKPPKQIRSVQPALRQITEMEFPFILDPSLIPQCFLDRLPLELGLHIISFLSDFKDVVALGRSSRQMYEISNLQPIWKSFHIKLIGSALDSSAEETNNWKLSFFNRMKRVLPSGFSEVAKSYAKPSLARAPTALVPSGANPRSMINLLLRPLDDDMPKTPSIVFKTFSSTSSLGVNDSNSDSDWQDDAATPPSRKRTWEDAFDLYDSDDEQERRSASRPSKIRRVVLPAPQGVDVTQVVHQMRRFYDDLEDLPVATMSE